MVCCSFRFMIHLLMSSLETQAFSSYSFMHSESFLQISQTNKLWDHLQRVPCSQWVLNQNNSAVQCSELVSDLHHTQLCFCLLHCWLYFAPNWETDSLKTLMLSSSSDFLEIPENKNLYFCLKLLILCFLYSVMCMFETAEIRRLPYVYRKLAKLVPHYKKTC